MNGLIVEDRNFVLSGPRRKDLKRLWVKDGEVLNIIARLKSLADRVENEVLTSAKESVAFLHDVRSSVSVLLSNTEALIAATPGKDFSQKLQKLRSSDIALFTVYQSINLLNEQLSLADLISNPDAIEYGQKSISGLHPFVFKMVKLFESRARSRGMRLELTGETDVKVSVLQSFQLVPIILLDNAIKYGGKGTNVAIRFSESSTKLDLDVVSFGDVVPPSEVNDIFERYKRGSNGVMVNPHGTGLGLYLARRICEVHLFEINYIPSASERSNTFRISIPRSEWES